MSATTEGYKVTGTTQDGKRVGWIGQADSPRDAVNQAEGQFGHLGGISTVHPVRTLLPSPPDDTIQEG